MALQRQLKRFPAVLLPARLMELLPASGFRIRSGKLPVRTGATEIVNVNERSLRTVVSAITLRNPIATSCESATRARGRGAIEGTNGHVTMAHCVDWGLHPCREPW